MADLSRLRTPKPLPAKPQKANRPLSRLRPTDYPQEEAALDHRLRVVRFKCRCRYCRMYLDPGERAYYARSFGAIHEDCWLYWLKRLPARRDDFLIELWLERRAIGG